MFYLANQYYISIIWFHLLSYHKSAIIICLTIVLLTLVALVFKVMVIEEQYHYSRIKKHCHAIYSLLSIHHPENTLNF